MTQLFTVNARVSGPFAPTSACRSAIGRSQLQQVILSSGTVTTNVPPLTTTSMTGANTYLT